MRSKGTLAPDDDHATITFHRTYPHHIDRVWDAISTPEGLRAWLMATDVSIDARTGGRIEMTSGPARFRSSGEILAWQPPHVFEYEWNVDPVPEMPRGERAIVRYELAADGDSTHVVVTYRRISMRTARGFLPGLHAFLDRLEGQLDGTPMPAFVTRFEELRAHYPEWSYAPAPGQ